MRFWLSIIALVCVVLASISGGLYALSAFLENGREARAVQDTEFELYELRQRQIREDVILSDFTTTCAEYDAEPVMFRGVVSCYREITPGAGNVASVEWLEENIDPTSK